MNIDRNVENNTRKCHVLIIDDSIQDFRLMSIMIRTQSEKEYEFYWAKDSKEAKIALSKLWIDLVAVDYRLRPELGTEVIETLRKTHPQIAYVLITGMEDPELYKAGLASGASGFLLKGENNTKLFEQTAQFAMEHKRVQNSLKASNESKNRLMSLLAHDLGDPLNALVDSLAVLRTQAKDLSRDDLITFIDASYRSAYEASNSAKSIIDWGRGQNGCMNPQFEMVNVTDTVSHVFNFLAIESEKKSVELHYQGDCGVKVYADQKMLTTVLRNLVGQAIRSANQNGSIDVRTRIAKGEMTFEIRNRGYEIEPASLSRMQRGIFKVLPKMELSQSLHSSLEMCWHMLDLQGSDLRVDSVPEIGTTFSFDLPITIPQADMEQVYESSIFDLPNMVKAG